MKNYFSLILLLTFCSVMVAAQQMTEEQQTSARFSLTYPIVGTNQMKSYDNKGVICLPSAGQSFFGQNANYPGSRPSYTNNHNGTVTDNVTGLMWSASVDLNGDGVINSGENDVKIFSSTTTSTTTQGTIGLAASVDETVGKNCLAVQLLSDTQVRTDLNLKDNWGKKGTKVWVHGRAMLFTQSEGTIIINGMSGTDNYSLDGNEPVITAISRVEAQQKAANGECFNLAGQRVAQPAKGLYIVNGKKVVVK